MKWTGSSLSGLMLLFVFGETISANTMVMKEDDEDISLSCGQGKPKIESICAGSLSPARQCRRCISQTISSCDDLKKCVSKMFESHFSPEFSCLLITYTCDGDGVDDDGEDSKGNEDRIPTTSPTGTETDSQSANLQKNNLTIALPVAAIFVVIVVVIVIIVCFRRWRTRHHAKQSGIRSGAEGKEAVHLDMPSSQPLPLPPTAPPVECSEYSALPILGNDRTSEVGAYEYATLPSGVTPYVTTAPPGGSDGHSNRGELNDGSTSPIDMDPYATTSGTDSQRHVTEASGPSGAGSADDSDVSALYTKVKRSNKEDGGTELHENPAYVSVERDESCGPAGS